MALDEAGKTFLAWLEQHRGGELANQCGRDLERINIGVLQTAGAGKLAITFTIAMAKDSDRVGVVDKAIPTVPENRLDTYWIDPTSGQLIRRRPQRVDPNQASLLAQDLDGPGPDETWSGGRPYRDDD